MVFPQCKFNQVAASFTTLGNKSSEDYFQVNCTTQQAGQASTSCRHNNNSKHEKISTRIDRDSIFLGYLYVGTRKAKSPGS
uniref:Uncharacterized protein n=1 Tax=Arundo donax TaxID=35708 RepID=A0A0A8XXQ3_ARUDO